MAHLLTPVPTTAATALSARARNISLYGSIPAPRVCCVSHQYQYRPSSIPHPDQVPAPCDDHYLRRRTLMGLSGSIVLGFNLSDEQSASGAARPPPPPPKERKDPNVSGVQAKVLASKRRKEAMKEEMAKLRERGMPINKESPPPPPSLE